MPQPTPPPGRLGLTLRPEPGQNGTVWFRVVAVDPGTPAQQSGVLVHDFLVAVDEMPVAGWKFDDVLVLLKGDAGTWVKMRMFRPQFNRTFDVMIQRQGQPGHMLPPQPPPVQPTPFQPPPVQHPNPARQPYSNGNDHLSQRMAEMQISGRSPSGSVHTDPNTQSWIQVPRENGQHQHPGPVPTRDSVLPMEGGMTGLVNLGNTCFMNSIVQCLVHTLPIATYLIFHMDEEGVVTEQNSKIATPKDTELVKAFKALFGHLWSGSHQSPLEPRSLIAAFKTDSRCKTLFNYKQQDAHELLCLLLDAIHQDTNGMVQSERGLDQVSKRGSSGLMGCFLGSRRKPPPAPELEDWVTEIDAEPVGGRASEGDVTDVDSVVSKFLAGRLCSEVQCTACSYKTQNRESFFTLSLPLPHRRPNQEATLQDCFRLFEGDEASIPWVCDKCKHAGAKKKIWVTQHPKVLIVHLERFGYHSGRKTKRDDCVTIPMRGLTLQDVPVDPNALRPPPAYYDMVGWTEHLGSDADGGHYVATCKHLDGHFYKFDDTRVTRMPYQPFIRSTTAYVLFYEKRD